jgi:hypothetical protein
MKSVQENYRREVMMKKIWYYSSIFLFVIVFTNVLFASVDSRLVLVSNTHNSPVSGQGTLVLNLEARSNDGTTPSISGYQNAIRLDPVFRTQVQSVSFSSQRFPASSYTTTEEYTPTGTRAGRIQVIYTLALGGIPTTIETGYTLIVSITIVYTMGPGSGSISWYSPPNYQVSSGVNFITGIREDLPAEFGDITLPVELTSFSASTEDNKVILTWVTQSEVNNLGFEVYRSGEENGNYVLIATYENNESLQGAGNSNAAREYTYEDGFVTNGETYWYQIADVDYDGIRTFHGPVSVESPDLIPQEYRLQPNYPNPFNPETNIRFEIPANPANSKVKLVIYNNLGMEVRTLLNGTVEPGVHTVQWDGRNNYGEQMASGVYFLRLQAGTFNQTQKMLLIR